MYACTGCGSESGTKFLACSGCRRAFYCDAACQRAHWFGEHKRLCDPSLGRLSQRRFAESSDLCQDVIESARREVRAARGVSQRRRETAERALDECRRISVGAAQAAPSADGRPMLDAASMAAITGRMIDAMRLAGLWDRVEQLRLGVEEFVAAAAAPLLQA